MTEDSQWDPWLDDSLLLEKIRNFSKSVPLDEVLENVIRAEIPVPDHLRNRSKEITSIRQLRLSQKLGALFYLRSEGCFFSWVKERTKYYQEVSNFEAILAAMEFSKRLKSDPRQRNGIKHALYYFLSTPFSGQKRRVLRKNRIRGYRDKGTLPDLHLRARNRAQEENFMSILALEQSTQEFLRENLPDDLFEGEYIDLAGVYDFLQTEKAILRKIEAILSSE